MGEENVQKSKSKMNLQDGGDTQEVTGKGERDLRHDFNLSETKTKYISKIKHKFMENTKAPKFCIVTIPRAKQISQRALG